MEEPPNMKEKDFNSKDNNSTQELSSENVNSKAKRKKKEKELVENQIINANTPDESVANASTNATNSSGESEEDVNHEELSTIIQLNVGGVPYCTTLQTLRKDSECMLHAMFSGRYKMKQDSKGSYFIDRDGTNFRYILNYLRDGDVDLPSQEHELKQILREALYYQIEGLIKTVQEALENSSKYSDKDKKGQYAVVYLGGYGKSAQIYTKDTGGGFSETCVTLNKLAAEGFHIEGVASGANGHYYAILRSYEEKNIFRKE